MKLIPMEIKEFEARIRKNTSNYKVLTEFVDSGMDCAKIEGWTQAGAKACANSLRTSIKRFRFGVRVVLSKGEVFLVKVK